MTNNSDDDPLKTGGALNVFSEVADIGVDTMLGRELGDYRITGLIAEGGMGRVFRAERIDGSFEREVAIKVSPVSGFSESMRDRFALEQSVLASLNHPNIAQLYDVQVTAEGWPYIVMELVDGGAITEHCKVSNNSVEDRIRLLIDIVDAVAYAHARLIVHRDIKPSNVLVNDDHRPKLLDFGIAKLLEGDQKDVTRSGPMTPQYASPEQLLGQQITTASDVYQLGILTYEVLTGERLNKDEAITTAIQRAADQKPLGITGNVRQTIPPEILLIIEQCLRPSADERYRDANSLRNDLQAYLDGYPVTAAGQSTGYRLRKFVGRNLPSTVITAVALLAIVGASSWYTWQLSAARDLAERRATTANRVLQTMSGLVANTFSGLVDANAEKNVGNESYIEAVLAETVTLIDRELEAEPGARAELLRVQGSIEIVLGNNASAAAKLEEAYSLANIDEDPEVAVQIMLERSEVASRMMEYDIARDMLDEAADLIGTGDFGDRVLAYFHHQSGQVLQFEGEYEAANQAYGEAVRILQAQDVPDTRLLASTFEEISYNYSSWDKHPETIGAANKAIEILEATESPMSHRLINPLRFAGFSLIMLDDFDGARANFERAMSIATANFGDVHPDVAVMQDSLGALAYREGRVADAAAHFEEMIRLLVLMDGEDSSGAIVPKLNVAVMYTDLGEFDKAGRYFQDVLEATKDVKSEEKLYRHAALENEGRRLTALSDYGRAALLYREQMDLALDLYGNDSFKVVSAEKNFARSLARSGDIEEARKHFVASAQRYGEIWGFGEEGHTLFSASNWILDLMGGDLPAARKKLSMIAADAVEEEDVDVIYWVEVFADLASICIAQGDMPCARESLDRGWRGAKTSPQHPWAYHLQVVEAEYLQSQQQIDVAQGLARSALEELLARYPTRTDDIRRARAIVDL